MILRPTAFVLGAGASAPYDFPLGGALGDRISNRLKVDNAFRQAILDCGIRKNIRIDQKKLDEVKRLLMRIVHRCDSLRIVNALRTVAFWQYGTPFFRWSTLRSDAS